MKQIQKTLWFALLSATLLVFSACSSTVPEVVDQPAVELVEEETADDDMMEEEHADDMADDDMMEEEHDDDMADDEDRADEPIEATDNNVNPDVVIMTEDDRSPSLQQLTSSWNTNWELHSVSYDEFLSGGPPRDGIPSIDNPTFVSIAEADEWLVGVEPVVALEINGDARAYPLQILTWHEICLLYTSPSPRDA